MTPWYESYQESKISALGGASEDPAGGGTRVTIDSRISSIPIPSLADAATAAAPDRVLHLVRAQHDGRTSSLEGEDLAVVVERIEAHEDRLAHGSAPAAGASAATSARAAAGSGRPG